MPRKVIGIDVDSTVWDAPAAYVEAAKIIDPENYHNVEDVDSWAYLYDRYGGRLFELALDPNKMDQRKLYPDCRRSIKNLQALGYKVAFVSHNHDPDAMSEPLTRWLRMQFGSRVGVCVLHGHESKYELLATLDAVGLIDDKPDTITEIAENGMLALMPTHPYNRDVPRGMWGVVPFDPHSEWKNVPYLVDSYVRAVARV